MVKGLRGAIFALVLVSLTAQRALGQDDIPASIETGFNPKLDGMPFVNLGDFRSPDGNCFGMSLTAIKNYLHRKAGDTDGLPKPKITKRTERADPSLEELVSYEQENVSQDPMHESHLDKPDRNMNAALKRMAADHMPEIFTMTGKEGGHANVIFGYENGAVLLYDPNYPGETIRWPYDPKKGFGKHPKASDSDFYKTLRTAGATPYDKFKAASDEDAVKAKIDDLSNGRYPKLTTSYDSSSAGKLVITGSVGAGPKKDEDGTDSVPPKRVWLEVDGKTVGHANVLKDGTFHLVLPSSQLTESSNARIVATADTGVFAGYTPVDAKALLAAADKPAPAAKDRAPRSKGMSSELSERVRGAAQKDRDAAER